ncbi:hypothetical protein CLOM_g20041 [Closterium sp. NIES-68]|nr:hypothetical protein CLOM_g20041 [Closterium sp. NIES-68]
MGLLSRLSHPHIVDTLGYKLLGGNVCLVATARMSQGTLLQWLRPSSPPLLDWPARVQVARSVARALAFAHSCDPPLPHGALSSRHVAFGGDLKPRVSGFAAARLRRLGGRSIISSLNPCVLPGGPPQRASSGAAQDDVAADVAVDVAGCIAADIHSFGLILLHLLTGRDSFLSPTAASSSSHPPSSLTPQVQHLLFQLGSACERMDHAQLLALADPCLAIKRLPTTMLSFVELAVNCASTLAEISSMREASHRLNVLGIMALDF